MDMLESIKTELDGNDLLLEDFPEVVYPIQCLDGIANRCSGQLYKGERTHIGWTAREVVLPTIPDSKAAGAIIKVAGITGRIRGMKFKRADGHSVRPSLVVLDDPQTDESARSTLAVRHAGKHPGRCRAGAGRPGQEDRRHHALHGDPPGRHGRPHPRPRQASRSGKGERTKMVYSFPTNESSVDRSTPRSGPRACGPNAAWPTPPSSTGSTARRWTTGPSIAWPERFNHDELSAIQHAMNLQAAGRAGLLRRVPERAVARGDAARKTNCRPTRSPPRSTASSAATCRSAATT